MKEKGEVMATKSCSNRQLGPAKADDDKDDAAESQVQQQQEPRQG